MEVNEKIGTENPLYDQLSVHHSTLVEVNELLRLQNKRLVIILPDNYLACITELKLPNI